MKRMQTAQHVVAAHRGFSLIELLIVLAILVLLATLVAPRLLGSREKANVDAAKAQIAMLKGPLEIYSLHLSGYPTTEQGLMALIERPSAGARGGDSGVDDGFGPAEGLTDFAIEEEDDVGANSNWQGPYIKSDKVPIDPWGSAYRYEYPGQNNSIGEPDIWSLGPDHKDNTEDDIVSWSGQQRRGGGRSDRSQRNAGEDQGFDTTPNDVGNERPIDLNE